MHHYNGFQFCTWNIITFKSVLFCASTKFMHREVDYCRAHPTHGWADGWGVILPPNHPASPIHPTKGPRRGMKGDTWERESILPFWNMIFLYWQAHLQLTTAFRVCYKMQLFSLTNLYRIEFFIFQMLKWDCFFIDVHFYCLRTTLDNKTLPFYFQKIGIKYLIQVCAYRKIWIKYLIHVCAYRKDNAFHNGNFVIAKVSLNKNALYSKLNRVKRW